MVESSSNLVEPDKMYDHALLIPTIHTKNQSFCPYFGLKKLNRALGNFASSSSSLGSDPTLNFTCCPTLPSQKVEPNSSLHVSVISIKLELIKCKNTWKIVKTE